VRIACRPGRRYQPIGRAEDGRSSRGGAVGFREATESRCATSWARQCGPHAAAVLEPASATAALSSAPSRTCLPFTATVFTVAPQSCTHVQHCTCTPSELRTILSPATYECPSTISTILRSFLTNLMGSRPPSMTFYGSSGRRRQRRRRRRRRRRRPRRPRRQPRRPRLSHWSPNETVLARGRRCRGNVRAARSFVRTNARAPSGERLLRPVNA